jgi:hypothetical protein
MPTHVFPIPDGDTVLIERLPGGGQRIYRASGRPIGELIPIGMDPSEGLLELITVEGTLAPLAVLPVHAETIAHTFSTAKPLSFSKKEMPTHGASTGSSTHQSGGKS